MWQCWWCLLGFAFGSLFSATTASSTQGTGLSGSVGSAAWAPSSGYRGVYNQQNLQAVLTSIDERLRGLDTMYASRFVPRLDLGTDQQSRRLDNIESRLGRLETLIELRLDKLTETLGARQLKDELAKDQLNRAMDTAFERLNHRMGYMETRMEMNINKLQASVDVLSGRLERIELTYGGQQGNVGPGLEDVKIGLDEIRRNVEGNHQNLLNITLKAVASGEGVVQQYYERLSTALDQIQSELNRSLTVQNDGGGSNEGPIRHERHTANSLLSTMDKHASTFSSKVTNMYNELWRRTQILEGLTKDSMALSNATRRELQEGLRSASMQLSRFCSQQTDKFKPGPSTLETVESKFAELSKKMGHYFQTLISAQHMFTETCHRVQESEPAFEKYLAQLLEKIVDLITNKTCENEMEEVHELLKSHHSTVVRNVGHSTSTVIRATDNSSKEIKNMANIVNGVRENLVSTAKDILNSIANMHEGQISVHQTLKRIASTMTDFQDQLSELGNTSNLKEITENECPESTITLEEITTAMKDLFKNYSKTTDYEELANLTHKLILMLKAVYPHIHQGGQKVDSFQILNKELLNTALDRKDTISLVNNHNIPNYVIPEAEENMLSNAMTTDNTHIHETIILKDFDNSSNHDEKDNHNDIHLETEQLEKGNTHHIEPFITNTNDHLDETTTIPIAREYSSEDIISSTDRHFMGINHNVTGQPTYREQDDVIDDRRNVTSTTYGHKLLETANNYTNYNNVSNQHTKKKEVQGETWNVEPYSQHENNISIHNFSNQIDHENDRNSTNEHKTNHTKFETRDLPSSTAMPVTGINITEILQKISTENISISETDKNTSNITEQQSEQKPEKRNNEEQGVSNLWNTLNTHKYLLQTNTTQNTSRTEDAENNNKNDKSSENWSYESQKIYSDMSIHQLLSKLEELAKLLKLDDETLDKKPSPHEQRHNIREPSELAETDTNHNALSRD